MASAKDDVHVTTCYPAVTAWTHAQLAAHGVANVRLEAWHGLALVALDAARATFDFVFLDGAKKDYRTTTSSWRR